MHPLVQRATGSGWRPLRPDTALRTGILLLEASAADTRTAPADAVRTAFRTAGVALSAYPGGRIRVSLPERPLESSQFDHLRRALCRSR